MNSSTSNAALTQALDAYPDEPSLGSPYQSNGASSSNRFFGSTNQFKVSPSSKVRRDEENVPYYLMNLASCFHLRRHQVSIRPPLLAICIDKQKCQGILISLRTARPYCLV